METPSVEHSSSKENEGKEWEERVEKIRALLPEFGISPENISEDILLRLALLGKLTPTVVDALHMKTYAERLFANYDREPSGTDTESGPLTSLERKEILEGTLFCDIGKTGPKDANFQQQQAVAELFSIENIQDPTITIQQVLDKEFVGRANAMAEDFRAVGVDVTMPMRAFWDSHVVWGADILQNARGIAREDVPVVAAHHELQGINPGGIVQEDGTLKGDFGENRTFGRAEKIVELLDLYDAFRRRGRKTHEEAIAALRSRVKENERFGEDAQFFSVINEMECIPPPDDVEAFYEQVRTGGGE